MAQSYTEEDIQRFVKIYIEKSKKRGYALSFNEFNNDSDLPSANAMRNHGYTIGRLQELSRQPCKYKRDKQPPEFCKFCANGPYNCDKDINECKKEARVYYEFYRK